ncbi:LEM3/CDC50 family protein [Plasmodium brasilianum]|uniref:LEM3/CDC50 family protein, putative n=2 Tax=Plasmodium (Plasmodium) TaxID=418103 RepID=A0A1A8WP70_PLAMA|nr:LEM3/CDC50 family protein, putative [Plasmodium malariae]KAI4838453.1 LEM3/CDC50 family protein [Plasmodium brasilianum]SBS93121.1 LEM3/CDC50 family protein, putative [Plasmodium malariae]SBT71430.1 LEM3/CDC50 family protein, putative [Plasmodium malariae]SCN12850.1 LEM3/CDC50 family protein, putative [Plasmodium malariae]
MTNPKKEHSEIPPQKGKLYYKKNSKYINFIYKFVQWYRIEKVVGPIWVHKYSATISFLLFLFFFNLILGINILLLSSRYTECRIPYEYKDQSYTKYTIVKVTHEHCNGNKHLKVLEGQINVHYEIHGIQQNHNGFITSLKKEQLSGNIFLKKEELNECFPLITYEHEGVNKLLHPCGILQWNVFTDNYMFYDSQPDEAPFPNSLPLKQKVEDITIKYFRKFFKNPSPILVNLYKNKVYFWMDEEIQSYILQENNETNEKLVVLPQSLKYNKAGNAIENSHFINWMIPSAFNYVKRLYAILDGPLTFPFYIYIENNFKINYTKIIVISNSNFYLSTTLLGVIFIITSILALILAFMHLIRMRKYNFK